MKRLLLSLVFMACPLARADEIVYVNINEIFVPDATDPKDFVNPDIIAYTSDSFGDVVIDIIPWVYEDDTPPNIAALEHAAVIQYAPPRPYTVETYFVTSTYYENPVTTPEPSTLALLAVCAGISVLWKGHRKCNSK